jgi:hypothetical protein
MEQNEIIGSPLELAPEDILVQEKNDPSCAHDDSVRCNACHMEQIACEEPQCPR